MPYVTQEKRPKLNKVVEALIDAQVVANGDLNYILYTYCKYNVKPSYNNYKNFIGELHECAHEIRRRLLGPYEDEKIKENGDC
jgi:hypothetical protein